MESVGKLIFLVFPPVHVAGVLIFLVFPPVHVAGVLIFLDFPPVHVAGVLIFLDFPPVHVAGVLIFWVFPPVETPAEALCWRVGGPLSYGLDDDRPVRPLRAIDGRLFQDLDLRQVVDAERAEDARVHLGTVDDDERVVAAIDGADAADPHGAVLHLYAAHHAQEAEDVLAARAFDLLAAHRARALGLVALALKDGAQLGVRLMAAVDVEADLLELDVEVIVAADGDLVDDVRLGREEVERVVEVRFGKAEDALPVGLDRDWVMPAQDDGIALDRFHPRVAQDAGQRVVLPHGLEAREAKQEG